jgi:hypothetical protein
VIKPDALCMRLRALSPDLFFITHVINSFALHQTRFLTPVLDQPTETKAQLLSDLTYCTIYNHTLVTPTYRHFTKALFGLHCRILALIKPALNALSCSVYDSTLDLQTSTLLVSGENPMRSMI